MRRPLRCYLLRPTANLRNSLTDAALERADAYSVRAGVATNLTVDELASVEPELGAFVVVTVSGVVPTPWWQELISAELEIDSFVVGPWPSRGAIVFCAVEDPTHGGAFRRIAWTFGTGSRSLRRTALEPRFGVICALNRIIGEGGSEALIRKLQYSQQGAYPQRTGHVAFHDTPLGGFRIDQIRDLLAAAGGTPANDTAQVFGGRNLVFRAEVAGLATLQDEATAAIADYRHAGYQEHFGFIDNYIPAEDPELIEELDAAVLTAILVGDDSVDIALPNDLVDFSDDRSPEYILLPGEQLPSASRTVLTIERVRSLVSEADGAGLDVPIRFADADHALLGAAALRECLAVELVVEGERYYLADGTYYHVSSEFIEAVDSYLDAIPHWGVDLPPYTGGKERDWIEAVGLSDDFTIMDQWFLDVPGRTRVEAADLVHASGALVHAKRKGRSSSLSYLFAQASASSLLLAETAEAVNQLRAELAIRATADTRHDLLTAIEALDRKESGLDVVFAILGDWANRGVRNLPLIAKLELQASVRAIEQRGFRPRLALVNLASRV